MQNIFTVLNNISKKSRVRFFSKRTRLYFICYFLRNPRSSSFCSLVIRRLSMAF